MALHSPSPCPREGLTPHPPTGCPQSQTIGFFHNSRLRLELKQQLSENRMERRKDQGKEKVCSCPAGRVSPKCNAASPPPPTQVGLGPQHLPPPGGTCPYLRCWPVSGPGARGPLSLRDCGTGQSPPSPPGAECLSPTALQVPSRTQAMAVAVLTHMSPSWRACSFQLDLKAHSCTSLITGMSPTITE